MERRIHPGFHSFIHSFIFDVPGGSGKAGDARHPDVSQSNNLSFVRFVRFMVDLHFGGFYDLYPIIHQSFLKFEKFEKIETMVKPLQSVQSSVLIPVPHPAHAQDVAGERFADEIVRAEVESGDDVDFRFLAEGKKMGIFRSLSRTRRQTS